MACVGGELFCALGFTFLRGEASSPRGGVSPRGYWFTTWRERSDWTRTSEAKIFRAREEPKIFASAYRFLLLWTRHSGVTVFPSARGSKNRYPAEGVSPRGCWFTTWGERSDWTRTSEAKIFRAREETKIFASPRAQARGVTGSSQRNVYSKNPRGFASGVLAISAPPTGLEPVTLRLTVECSAN